MENSAALIQTVQTFIFDLRTLLKNFCENRPSILLVIPILSGCIANYYSYTVGTMVFLILAFTCLPFHLRKWIGVTLIGGLWMGYLSFYYPGSPLSFEAKELNGTVVDVPRHGYFTQFTLQTDSLRFNIQHHPLHHNIKAGQTLRVRGFFKPASKVRNPGEFNLEGFLKAKNLVGNFRSDSIEVLRPPGTIPGFINKIRAYFLGQIENIFTPQASPIIKAMLLGSRGGIDPTHKKQFIESGMIHLLAISGMHVGVISLILVHFFTVLRFPPKLAMLISGLVLLVYIFITGSSISVCRSVIMFVGIIPTFLGERPTQTFNNLGLAGCLCLIFMPYQILSLGFKLSFAATFFLIYYAPLIRKIDVRVGFKNPIIKYVVSTITVSLLLYLVTYPILANTLNQVAPWTLVTNIPALFLAGLLVLSACLSLMLYPLSSYLGELLGETTSLVSYLLSFVIKTGANLPGSPQRVSELHPIYTFSLFCALLIIPNLHRIRFARMVLFILGFTSSLYFASSGIYQSLSQNTDVHFVDVGQGDATLLTLPTDYHILIDAGKGSVKGGSGKRVLEPLMRHKGIQKLDLVIITHGDLDHYGGLLYLATHFPIEQVVYSGLSQENKSFSLLRKILKEKQIPLRRAFCGDTLYHYQQTFLEVKSPCFPQQFRGKNNNSLVTVLKAHQKTVLFPGDIEASAEKWLTKTLNKSVHILKVPHHGSKTSSTRELLSVLTPQIAIISSGWDNSYGFPHKPVLQNLNRHTALIYNTGTHGAIVYRISKFRSRLKTFIDQDPLSVALN